MAAVDRKIDQATGEFVVENGRLQLVTGADAAGQRIFARLHALIGEWFLDLSFGIPYLTDVFVSAPQLNFISGIFKTEILAGAGGTSFLKSFDATIDTSTRVLTVDSEVQFSEDETITVSETF